MPGYDLPYREVIPVGELIDFAAGVHASSFKGPKGLKGRLVDIIVSDVTEIFNEDTTEVFLQVGTTGDPDKYAKAGLGVTATTDTYRLTQDDDLSDPLTGIFDADLPADTQIEILTIQNTGGTPTGIASAYVVVDWY